MSDILKRAAEALEGVTPGPWEVRGKQTVGIGVETVAKCGWRNGKNDARFIAAARDLVPEMAAEIERLTARAEAAEAILADAGVLRDAAGRVSEWFCTEARGHEGPRINALRMAMIAYDRHMQPAPHAAMKEGR